MSINQDKPHMPNCSERVLGVVARCDVSDDEEEYAKLFARYRERILAPFVRFAARSADVFADQHAEDELRSIIESVREGDIA